VIKSFKEWLPTIAFICILLVVTVGLVAMVGWAAVKATITFNAVIGTIIGTVGATAIALLLIVLFIVYICVSRWR
jgi:hypothetical protein